MTIRGCVVSTLQNIGIPEPDGEILADYLVVLHEQSDHSAKNALPAITGFYKCMSFKALKDMNIDDINAYVDYLKSLPWKDSAKGQEFQLVKTWVRRFLKRLAAQQVILPNLFDYVDNPFGARHRSKHVDTLKINLEMDTKDNIKSLTSSELETIMQKVRLESKWFQVLLLVLKFTGMRLSEAVTLRLENIDLKERVLASGVVKNHRKTGKVVFFIPPHVATEIKAYTMLLDDGEEWLFPAKYTTDHVTKGTVTQKLDRFSTKIRIDFTAHQFRHTIIKNRELMGCPSHVNEFLQNQAVTGTQATFYRERNFTLRDRRDLYDKWNPY